MGWSWTDYLMTPLDVIEAAVLLADDIARERERASRK